ncbi:DNA topoisomerase 2-binding protein 1 [Polyrhizophydium stewartii]|uniref:DNA topoisomerase 2-binding protein 1 n=1 Tax=Polyrhizophydium stewartii TaxID=2732419 RepID=A0ABR4NAP3_9FUNG
MPAVPARARGALAGFVVCVSALSEADRALVERRVLELGGSFSGCLTTQVTHLISSSTSTEKYKRNGFLASSRHPPTTSRFEPLSTLGAMLEELTFCACLQPFQHYLLPPFKGILVCVSGYPTSIRSEIEQRVMDLGGAFTFALSRDCTHLICSSPSGSKYNFAREWKLSIVSIEWLNECCRKNGRVDEADFPVVPIDESADGGDIPDGGEGVEWSRTNADETSKFLCASFHIVGFAEAQCRAIQARIVQAGGTVKKTANADFVLAPFVGSADASSIVSGSSRSNLVTEYWLEASIECRECLDPAINVMYRPSTKSFPIRATSLKISITGYESYERFHLTRAIGILGSSFSDKLSKTCQILVSHPVKGPAAPKFQKAREWRIKIVDGDWLLACLSEGKYVDCEPFVLPRDPASARKKARDSRVLDLEADGFLQSLSRIPPAAGARGSIGRLQDALTYALDGAEASAAAPAHCTEPNGAYDGTAAAGNASRGVSSRHESPETHMPRGENRLSGPEASGRADAASPRAPEVAREPIDDLSLFIKKPRPNVKWMLNSQRPIFANREPSVRPEDDADQLPARVAEVVASVTYTDPEGLNEKRKLLERLESPAAKRRSPHGLGPADRQPSDAHLSTRDRDQQNARQTLTHRDQERVFLFSGIPQQQRRSMAESVKRVGGRVLDIEGWDHSCTHLVVSAPGRSEKFLAACASGRWILKPSYIQACASAGKFVPEEEHEWNEADDDLGGAAARRWRRAVQLHGSRGSFKDWTVLLLVDDAKRDGFVKVLSSGGAQVVVGKPSLRGVDENSFTHAIVDSSKTAAVARLAKLGIAAFDTQLVVDFLFNESPNVDRFRLRP